MLKGNSSKSAGKSSEDGLYKFLELLRIEGGIFSQICRLSGTFLIGHFLWHVSEIMNIPTDFHYCLESDSFPLLFHLDLLY
jgi:hypothetical protein